MKRKAGASRSADSCDYAACLSSGSSPQTSANGSDRVRRVLGELMPRHAVHGQRAHADDADVAISFAEPDAISEGEACGGGWAAPYRGSCTSRS
jgi:hypothetical protein